MIILKYYFYFSFLIGAFIALVAGFAAFYNNRKSLVHILWFITNVFSAIWSVGYFLIISAESKFVALYSSWLLHGAAILLATFYFHFVLVFANKVREKKHYLYLAYANALFLLIINPTPYFVRDVVPRFIFNYTPLGGPLFFLFALHFWCIAVYAAKILYTEMKKNTGTLAQQYKHILLADVGFIGGGSTFLFTFNINIPPFTIIMYPLYPIIVTYAIVKHRLFNAKIIATELLVFSIWIFLLARLILSDTWQDKFIDGTLLVFVIFVGILLVRSVWKEIETREKMEALTKELAKANAELKKLDQLKSDFLSFATHQLRSPLTITKGYISMIQEGTFGQISERVKEILARVYSSNEQLIRLVNDFLNVSRIEQGRVDYTFTRTSLIKLVDSVIVALGQNAERRELKLVWEKPKEEIPEINIDEIKIHEVIYNLVDNAIKYTEKGSVTVNVERKPQSILISVKDTGIGLKKDDIPNLFQRFGRAESGKQLNVAGTGIGLYVAKYMVEGHKGKIWAESEGKGKGSTFYVELPV